MLTLYSRPGSGGFVVEAALALADVPFRLVNVERNEVDDAFRAISPLGQVPVLRLSDGTVMTESAALSMLIAEQHPEAALAPAPGTPERPDFLRWMLFMSSVLYPALLRYFYSDRYTADPEGNEAVKSAAVAETNRAFAIVDAALEGRDWIAGDFSIADIYLVMLAHWCPPNDRPLPEWSNIVRHAERVKVLPVMVELNRTHRMW